MVTTKLNLSMTEPQVRQIYAKQGDTGRVLDITLDQTPEDGTLRILRPDGVEVTSEAVTGGEVESGSTFESLTEADVTELTVGIEPIQDLNGYDKPWVGGGGKNKFAVNESATSSSYITSASADTGIIGIADVSSPVWITPYIGYSDVESGKTYTISSTDVMPYCRVGGSTNTNYPTGSNIPDTDIGVDIRIALNYQSSSKTFTANASGRIYWFVCTDTHISAHQAFNLQVTVAEGSSPSTWQPYSNICPITGHDEVRVYDDPVYGKTIVWNQILRNGNFARTSDWAVSSGSSFTVSNNVATFRADAPYRSLTQSTPTQERVPKLNHVFMGIIKAKSYTNTNTFFYVRTVGSAVLQTASKTLSTTEKEYVNVLKVTQESYYFQFMVQDNNASGYGDITVQNARFFDLTEMFGEGNEPTIEEFEALFPKDYYPHNTGVETTVSAVNGNPNRQYTTSLGQTVYGGTLDMVSGVLTVDKAMVDLGSLTWSMSGSGNTAFFYANTASLGVASDITTSLNYICENYSIVAVSSGGTATGMAFTSASQLRIRDATYSDATSFKTAMNGVQLVYQLATPVEYQLTPQQIKTLVGTNNVWASSGDIVNITFTYGGLLSELPSEATEIVGKCYCDIEQNGVSSMPFTLNVKKNERQ